MKEDNLEEKWGKIKKIIESTRDSDFERILVVPLEEWNPSILSEERKRLLLTLKGGKIESETDLAKQLGRKRPNVVTDLKLLEHYGLIERIKRGRRTVPRIVKNQIVIY